ncbi:TPA: hypothetical protein N0F65_012278 [Lagenidium giganteum]|uniref:Uncharacterized protein n=1 Tax=Lagenidium giganteum TaxID=4803 RepID=A0AAV2ZG11_9STRA|nr:TPA: hypothetical protein N0F65_012278 [Lagenidium giganteum]
MMSRVVSIIEPILSAHFVHATTMTAQRNRNDLFSNYQYALYANDVKLQPSLRPSGNFTEVKRSYSCG